MGDYGGDQGSIPFACIAATAAGEVRNVNSSMDAFGSRVPATMPAETTMSIPSSFGSVPMISTLLAARAVLV